MALFDVWHRFGFNSNPYSEATLEPNELGHRLLSGRDIEVRSLQGRLGSGGTHCAVEGPVGAGKTSLINVAAYRMYRHCLDRKQDELYLPCIERFQPLKNPQQQEKMVLMAVAQTLIRYREDFEKVGLRRPNTYLIDEWLNSAEFGGWQIGVAPIGQYGRQAEPNTGEGYALSGFSERLRGLLDESFPPGSGGVICILDNLEVAESAGAARTALDTLRDRLFNISQLRWVLCGSRGIVSRARTERLSGVFQAPMILKPLRDEEAVSVVRKRIENYGTQGAVAPVSPEAFDTIYSILNRNLRDSLATAQEFAHWLDDTYGHVEDVPDDQERAALLMNWMQKRSQKAYMDAQNVQPRQWRFFEKLCSEGGRCGSSEWTRYGFGVQQHLTTAVTALADANLMVREADPENGSRTVNAVTPLGWLVHHHLEWIRPEPLPLEP